MYYYYYYYLFYHSHCWCSFCASAGRKPCSINILYLLLWFLGVIVTGSWDKNIKLWDPRANQCTGTYQQPEKVLKTILECLSPKSNHFLFYCVVEAASGENQAGQLTNNEVLSTKKKAQVTSDWLLNSPCKSPWFLFETKQEILIRSRVTYSCTVLFHSLCHYWDRLFTSEIATSRSIWIPCIWLAVKIRSRQINRFGAGFFFQMSGCPTSFLIIWWTLLTPTQFACYHFPIT